MRQPGRPPMPVRVALVAACYACVLIGGALLQHAAPCPDTPRPHCALCACLDTVSIVAPSAPAPVGFAADAGVVLLPDECVPFTIPSARLLARAPPANVPANG